MLTWLDAVAALVLARLVVYTVRYNVQIAWLRLLRRFELVFPLALLRSPSQSRSSRLISPVTSNRVRPFIIVATKSIVIADSLYHNFIKSLINCFSYLMPIKYYCEKTHSIPFNYSWDKITESLQKWPLTAYLGHGDRVADVPVTLVSSPGSEDLSPFPYKFLGNLLPSGNSVGHLVAEGRCPAVGPRGFDKALEWFLGPPKVIIVFNLISW